MCPLTVRARRFELSAPLVSGGNVTDFQVSPIDDQVVYRADQNSDEVFELFAVLAPCGGSQLLSPTSNAAGLTNAAVPSGVVAGVPLPRKINGSLVPGGDVGAFKFSPDGRQIVYIADEDHNDVFELYRYDRFSLVHLSKINAPLVSGGNVVNFQISSDSGRVLYVADQNVDQRFELFSVPIRGLIRLVDPVTRLNGPLASGGGVRTGDLDFQASPDGQRAFYLAAQDSPSVTELYEAFDAPIVAFAQPNYVVAEDGSISTTLTVQRRGILEAPASVHVQLTGETATGGASLLIPGADFEDNALTVNFAAGQDSAALDVPIANDHVAEAPETFSMLLFQPVRSVIGAPNPAEVVIKDTSSAPLLAGRGRSIVENSPNGTPLPPSVASEALAASSTVSYTILSGNVGNAFGIDATGTLFVNNSAALDYETTPAFVLAVQTRDSNGSFDVATVTVNLTNQNEPPTIDPQTRSVLENSITGSLVGAPLIAGDPDAGDQLSFATTSSIFSIDNNGQIRVKDGPLLVSKVQFIIDVTVKDAGGLSATAQVTIDVSSVATNNLKQIALVAHNPTAATAGGRSFWLRVSGANFSSSAVVRWNGHPLKTKFVSTRLLYALVPSADIAKSGTAKIDVVDALHKQTSKAVVFAIYLAKVGISQLTVEGTGADPQSVPGQMTVFVLSWTHTSGPWRGMNLMDLRLRSDAQTALWVRYHEATAQDRSDASTLTLLNADGTPAGSGGFGESKVLENATVRLDLAQASFTGCRTNRLQRHCALACSL